MKFYFKFSHIDIISRIRCERVCRKWLDILISNVWKDVNCVLLELKRIVINSASVVGRLEFSLAALEAVIGRCALTLEDLSLRRLVNEETSLSSMKIISATVCNGDCLKRFEMTDCTFEQTDVDAVLGLLKNIFKIKSLRTLILDSNVELVYGGRPSSLITNLPIYSILTDIKCLTALHLEDTPLSSRYFITLCKNLGQTLEKLCFKMENCEINSETIATGFSCLVNLVELNIGGKRPQTRPVSSLITDQSLNRFTLVMPKLERINIRSACKLTSNGVLLLLENCPKLSHLNISRCHLVTNRIGMNLRNRTCDHNITILAYLTSIDPSTIGLLNSSVHLIIRAEEQDESLFWGEKKPMALEQSYMEMSDDSRSDVSFDSSDSENWDW